ncbi:MAG TPA: Ig-like domain-containing protein, partial [Myxococcota bacterium]
MRRIALVLVVAVVMVSAVACSETPPDKLTMDPSGPFHFSKKGESEEVRLAAYKGKEPYVKKVDAEWKSSDPSVATVDGSGTGKISATGSGTATITATAWGLTSTAQVSVRIVG